MIDNKKCGKMRPRLAVPFCFSRNWQSFISASPIKAFSDLRSSFGSPCRSGSCPVKSHPLSLSMRRRKNDFCSARGEHRTAGSVPYFDVKANKSLK